MQQSPEEETPFVYVTLATFVTLATAGYTPCLFGYVTIGLARHNRTHFSQSERLLVKPKRPCTDLCAEPVGVWNRLASQRSRHESRHIHQARAVMHVGIANPRWQGKRSRHSRRMLQFYVSGKRPMVIMMMLLTAVTAIIKTILKTITQFMVMYPV